MTRIERRVLTNCVLAGALLTSLVVLAELAGWLQVPENLMYDLRARGFQFFSKPPTDQLVHLDIDDKALEGIGRWPWPRSQMAQIIYEIHAAGAKAVALDILYADQQDPSYVEVDKLDSGAVSPGTTLTPSPTGSPSTSQPAPPAKSPTDLPRLRLVDHDKLLADAVRRSGNIILPGSFLLDTPTADPLRDAAVRDLTADVELSESELAAKLRPQFPADTRLDSQLANLYLEARREAVYKRLEKELTIAPRPVEDLRRQLIKRRDASVASPLSRLIEEQYVRVKSGITMSRFGIQPPATVEAFVPARLNYAPIDQLGQVMAATSFVDFKASRDGVLRYQPLMLESNGRLYSQFGFSLALLYLGATPADVTFTPDTATIACPDGRKIVIPVSSIYSDSLHRRVPAIFNIPWFGGRNWESMYDWPEQRRSKQHLSMNAAYDPVITRQKIIRSNLTADRAMQLLYKYLGMKTPPVLPDDDVDGRIKLIDRALSEGKELFDAFNAAKPEELDEEGRMVRNAAEDVKTIRRENLLQQAQLVSSRAELSRQLGGKAVLIGFTATGNQDAVPTSLHASCPGVVTHGVIFNAIISEHFWRVLPEWVTIAFTIGLGALTAAVAWKFSPLAGFLITSCFGLGYVMLNGLYFFDHLHQIVGLAAPQIAMGSVWSGCTLARIMIESSERQRIIRRFQRAVDPEVVNFMMERPDEVRMQGETRELTVCFSDIGGFTALSEKLGHDIVPVLNEFMDTMVPIIRRQHGTIDKLLGDGIMYFFGAPVPSSQHATDAVATALLMQHAAARFNEKLIERKLPTIAVRIGINTGPMVVGDAGSNDYTDYTVLGDNVNLASRLESANKQIGTSILISARTAELAGDRFLLRPVGSLQVVGKTEGVVAYEVCGLPESATPEQHRRCQQTKSMVEQFRAKGFQEANRLADELDKDFGRSTLTAIYRELSAKHLAHPPADPFDGKIVFTEK